MNINGYTRLAAVVANPIKHSNSPFIHNMAFEMTEVNGVYLAFEIENNNLAQIIENIKIMDMYGVNLSMPFKKEAVKYVDELTPVAELIGAINTIVLKDDGSLLGHSTDGSGFFNSLENYHVEGQTISILGGGGAALAIIAEACVQKANKVFVFNRKSANYPILQEKLNKISKASGVEIILQDLADEEKIQGSVNESTLLINATSIGMKDKSMPINPSLRLPEGIVVADIIYQPAETEFLKWAKSQNVRTINGLGMLVYQAAESYELWTGKKMPALTIKEALERKIYETRS